MVNYDPQIIEKFAARLYRQAKTAIITSTIVGILFGALLGVGLGPLLIALEVYILDLTRRSPITPASLLVGCLAGAVLFGLIGFMTGRERAFRLRLVAQTSLCQLKIEENTRQ